MVFDEPVRRISAVGGTVRSVPDRKASESALAPHRRRKGVDKGPGRQEGRSPRVDPRAGGPMAGPSPRCPGPRLGCLSVHRLRRPKGVVNGQVESQLQMKVRDWPLHSGLRTGRTVRGPSARGAGRSTGKRSARLRSLTARSRLRTAWLRANSPRSGREYVTCDHQVVNAQLASGRSCCMYLAASVYGVYRRHYTGPGRGRSMPVSLETTQILIDLGKGDRSAANRLVPPEVRHKPVSARAPARAGPPSAHELLIPPSRGHRAPHPRRVQRRWRCHAAR
jgi:hypothetical protein